MKSSVAHCCFPTLGQAIKFAYDAFGVLPRKRGKQDGLTEQEKRRIAKQLERLAKEDGNLNESAGDLIRNLGYIVAGTITNAKVGFALGEAGMDIFDVYNVVIRTDGTYLGERDNIDWFCQKYAVPRLVISISKQLVRFNLAGEELAVPSEDDWFLPTISGGEVTWPLAKAMYWAYEICDTSETRFHYPEKSTSTEIEVHKQRLDNATQWRKGKALPSWPALHWTFSESIERLRSTPEAAYRREIPDRLRDSILIALFLARLSTYVCNALADLLGIARLHQLVTQFRRHQAWLAPDIAGLRARIDEFIRANEVPTADVDGVWARGSHEFWTSFCDRLDRCGQNMQVLIDRHDGEPLAEEFIRALIDRYGEYSVRIGLEIIETHGDFSMPDGFAEALLEGLALRKRHDCNEAEIDGFAEDLRSRGLMYCLGWMAPWLRARLRYRREDYVAAFESAEEAFEQAKYCAGGLQRELVEMLIDLAAKANKWLAFKKGVAWARYLGIRVRELDNNEPTNDDLQTAFDLRKRIVRINF